MPTDWTIAGWPIEHDPGTYIEVLPTVVCALTFFALRALLTGKAFSVEQAAQTGILLWVILNLVAFLATVCAIPALLLSTLVMLVVVEIAKWAGVEIASMAIFWCVFALLYLATLFVVGRWYIRE